MVVVGRVLNSSVFSCLFLASLRKFSRAKMFSRKNAEKKESESGAATMSDRV